MAKETKKTEQPVESTNVDNIVDRLKAKNLMSQAIAERVKDEIDKEQDDKNAQELKEAILASDYLNNKALLQVRYDRAKARITKEKVVAMEVLKDNLAGYVLTEDKIAKHGGKDSKLEVEVVTDYKTGTKEKKTFALKKGEEVWVPGTITPNEFNKKKNELSREFSKKYDECAATHNDHLTELKNAYPGWWRHDWD